MTEKLAVSVAEAAKIAGVGRTTLYAAIAVGQLKVKKCGSRTLVMIEDLCGWLRMLPEFETHTALTTKTLHSERATPSNK